MGEPKWYQEIYWISPEEYVHKQCLNFWVVDNPEEAKKKLGELNARPENDA